MKLNMDDNMCIPREPMVCVVPWIRPRSPSQGVSSRAKDSGIQPSNALQPQAFSHFLLPPHTLPSLFIEIVCWWRHQGPLTDSPESQQSSALTSPIYSSSNSFPVLAEGVLPGQADLSLNPSEPGSPGCGVSLVLLVPRVGDLRYRLQTPPPHVPVAIPHPWLKVLCPWLNNPQSLAQCPTSRECSSDSKHQAPGSGGSRPSPRSLPSTWPKRNEQQPHYREGGEKSRPQIRALVLILITTFYRLTTVHWAPCSKLDIDFLLSYIHIITEESEAQLHTLQYIQK